MLKYVVKRVLMGVLTIFVLATVVFFLMHALPGSPFDSDKITDPRVLEIIEAHYNLDKPIFEQYILYLKGILFEGDWGASFKKAGMLVSEMISRLMPVTARVGAVALVVALVMGVSLGIIAALSRSQLVKSSIVVFATIGISVPSFLLALLMIYLFAVELGWLPTMGLTTWKHYIMPTFALSCHPIAFLSRMTRSTLNEVLRQDYIVMARSKGLSKVTVTVRHALKNALLPVVTYAGPLTANLLTGSFVTETMFSIPGIGREFVTAINGRDYPVIMGLIIFLGAIVVLMNLLSDIAAAVVDPRIRLDK